ncbi:protein starmaker-like [Sander lucioperca]|uniref:Protein starmaker-like n=1 Tax=Sander lucioperca TaxID=283035 RepID=A0A8C9YVJ1_SANLU|nr:protein starmaker-like [Sander lucioperca]
MKFGLLVVLAVAVLVPSLSEGRTVSRCELKEKLGQAITLPPRLQKFKEEYLAIVICEVNSRSRLNTGLVKVFGKRRTTTTARPTTTVTTLAPRVNETTAETITTQPTTTQLTTTQPTTTQLTTTQPTTTQPTTTQPIPTDATNSTIVLNRRKRGVSSEEFDSAEMHSSQGELLNEGDEVTMQGVNGTVDEGGDKAKDSDKRDEGEDEDSDEKDEDEDEDSDERDEDEAEDGGKRKKRSKEDRSSEDRSSKDRSSKDRSSEDRSSEDRSSEETNRSSLGLYGIFQLSDETFCNSGYRSSKNKCNTTCDAFTDDDISDDIACFVKTDQWGLFLKSASRLCQIGTKNFFDECK